MTTNAKWTGARFVITAGILVVGALGAESCGRIVGVTMDTPANNMRVLLIALEMYKENYKHYPQELGALGPIPPGLNANVNAAGLIDGPLASGRKNGYVYRYRRFDIGKNLVGFEVTADPLDQRPGQLHYFANETGAVRFETDRVASGTSPEYTRDN